MISHLTERTIHGVKDRMTKMNGINQIRDTFNGLTERCSFGKTNEKYKNVDGMIAENTKLILTKKSLAESSLNT
jgi:hypothetical protein